MTRLMTRWAMVLVILIFNACGSGGDSLPNFSAALPTDLGEPITFKYAFSLRAYKVDDKGSASSYSFAFPGPYSIPLYVKPNGIVSVVAKEFPTMVVRICPKIENSIPNCNAEYDLPESARDGVDLVLDLCNAQADHYQCADDNTIFVGSLTKDGKVQLNNLSVRIRAFVLAPNDPSVPTGFTAKESNEGFFPDVSRLNVNVTSGAISTGVLSGQGSDLSADNKLRLVSGGIIPAELPELKGTHYLSVLDGSFDENPLELLK